MDCKKVGCHIAALRKEKGLTQKALADKLFITDKAVSKWERGLSCPDVGILTPLSDELGISVAELLNGEPIDLSDKKSADYIITDSTRTYVIKEKRVSIKKQCFILLLATLLTITGILSYSSATSSKNNRYASMTYGEVYDTMSSVLITLEHIESDDCILSLSNYIELKQNLSMAHQTLDIFIWHLHNGEIAFNTCLESSQLIISLERFIEQIEPSCFTKGQNYTFNDKECSELMQLNSSLNTCYDTLKDEMLE